MNKKLLKNKKIRKNTEIYIFKTLIRTTVTYIIKTTVMNKKEENLNIYIKYPEQYVGQTTKK